MNNPYDTKINTRKACHYIFDRKKRKDFSADLYPSMLIEDLHLGIMPIGGRSKNQEFTITLESEKSNIEELIINGLPTRHGKPYTLTEAVCDFIDEAAHHLAYFGKVHYEMVYYFEKAEEDKPIAFTLENIPNMYFLNKFGLCGQFLPSKPDFISDEKYIRLRWLPKDTILTIKFPERIGGKKGHLKLLNNLKWLSKDTIPKFAMDDLKNQKQQAGYDFNIYKRNKDSYIGKITKELGWPVRGLLSNQTVEFYQRYRYLKFTQTKAILREAILKDLNRALKKIGKKIGFDVEIKINGLLSSLEIEKYIEGLISGEVPFSKVVEVQQT